MPTSRRCGCIAHLGCCARATAPSQTWPRRWATIPSLPSAASSGNDSGSRREHFVGGRARAPESRSRHSGSRGRTRCDACRVRGGGAGVSPPVGERRPAGPAPEGAVKGARLGEAEEEPDLAESESSLAQVARGQLAAELRKDPTEPGSLLAEAAMQRSRAHVEAGGEALELRVAAAQLLFQQ